MRNTKIKNPRKLRSQESDGISDCPTMLICEDEVHLLDERESIPQSGDVWYRLLLQPLTRKNRAVPYSESFQRRMMRPAGIPVFGVTNIHELFKPAYRQYSPLFGMIYTYNNFIDNLYRYGDPQKPAVHLVQHLFHGLPGGEIQTTHLGGAAGAHLSPAIIGKAFETFEELRPQLEATKEKQREKLLADRLLSEIVNHPDYQDSQKKLFADVQEAEAELEALHEREANSKSVRERIKILEGDTIKKSRHAIKRAQKVLWKAKQVEHIEELKLAIKEHEEAMEKAGREVAELRTYIVTSAEFKTARKAVRRAQDMVGREKETRESLVTAMACSFCSFDLDGPVNRIDVLPKYTTTAVLLGYLWRKYDSLNYLKGYLESMDRLGALQCDLAMAVDLLDDVDPTHADKIIADHHFSRHRRKWTASDVSTASATIIVKPGLTNRPPIVPFSYVAWSSYSKFPDCGEKALHNLFNQLLFNPAKGAFDYELLSELRDSYYPNLKQKLIDFYREHSRPQDATDHEVAREWIEVTSHLNASLKEGPAIHYRREKQQQNIASSMRNALYVFNALFGIEPLNRPSLTEVVDRINSLRGWNLVIGSSRITADGFGTVFLSDGQVRYELRSYKPVHFAFVQVDTMVMDLYGRRDFEVFRKLMHYISGPVCIDKEDPGFFEQLALASLFVPYNMQRRKQSRIFQNLPLHVQLLFADINGSLQRQSMLKLASQHSNDPQVAGFIKRIRDYVEPTFMPTKDSDDSEED